MNATDLLRSKRSLQGEASPEGAPEQRTLQLSPEEIGSYQDGDKCSFKVSGTIQGGNLIVESLDPANDSASGAASPDGKQPIYRAAVVQSPS